MKKATYTVIFKVPDDHPFTAPSVATIRSLLSDAITDPLEIEVRPARGVPVWVSEPDGIWPDA